MTELEKLKQQLNEISEKVKQLENPKFEVGKWYKTDIGSLYFAEKIENDRLLGYGFGGVSGDWDIGNINGCCLLSDIIRPATDKEVEEALIKEAERRGFKKGVKISRKNEAFSPNLGYSELEMSIRPMYRPERNRLEVYGCSVFQNGFWAEIIKDEPIKVGGVDCVVDSCGAWFDKNQYSWEEINSLVKVFKNHSSQLKSINVGCSGQYKVDLELLEKILALKK